MFHVAMVMPIFYDNFGNPNLKYGSVETDGWFY